VFAIFWKRALCFKKLATDISCPREEGVEPFVKNPDGFLGLASHNFIYNIDPELHMIIFNEFSKV
jgi:hypothetical protein